MREKKFVKKKDRKNNEASAKDYIYYTVMNRIVKL